ncbi:hypothetical protein [Lactococcus cremoris]|uniref:hypothetical protein n=1 Tax=Lactococcus lactis subsp. cremoris TaxID=1359 RepID=UPI002FC85272
MKLSEIEAYAYEVIYPDCDGELFFSLYLAKERAAEVGGDIRMLYTAEQMQAFMFKNVSIALAAHELYEAEVCGFHLSQWEKEETGKIIQELFMEDTKND